MFTLIKSVGKWNISTNTDKTELMFDNGNECTYAYYHDLKHQFYFDRLIAPKTVVNVALSWAKKNMVSIYTR